MRMQHGAVRRRTPGARLLGAAQAQVRKESAQRPLELCVRQRAHVDPLATVDLP